jgi:hypothetical protein
MVFIMNLCRLAADTIRVELRVNGEQLIYSKHVEYRLFELFKQNNCILLVFIKKIYHDARSRKCEVFLQVFLFSTVSNIPLIIQYYQHLYPELIRTKFGRRLGIFRQSIACFDVKEVWT